MLRLYRILASIIMSKISEITPIKDGMTKKEAETATKSFL